MSEHTPGRLEVAVQVFDNDGCPETVIQGMGGAASVAVALDFGPNNPCMREANARRLVAAWNWCDGLSTQNLEDNVSAKELAHRYNAVTIERDSLRAVNAELLEALEGLVEAEESMRATYTCEYGKTPEDEDHFGHEKWAGEFLLERADSARAAIASARKQGEQG